MHSLILPIRMKPFWGNRFTVCARVGDTTYKLFQVLFPPLKQVLHINCPYFPDSRGIAALATLPGDGNSQQQLELQREGKLTTHLIKYTHPADGRAHFSQDRKVVSTIRKQATPLKDHEGHMFSLLLSGLTKFEELDESKEKLDSVKNGGVIFQLEEDPGWVKVVGYWHRRDLAVNKYLRYADADGLIGPTVGGKAGGTIAFLAPWNKGNTGTHVLALIATTQPGFDAGISPMQLFIGGFDPEPIVNDPFQKSSVLVFKYPATDFESLKSSLESIDYFPYAF